MTWRVRAATFDAHPRDAGSAVGGAALVTASLGGASGSGAEFGALHAVVSTARHITRAVASDQQDAMLR